MCILLRIERRICFAAHVSFIYTYVLGASSFLQSERDLAMLSSLIHVRRLRALSGPNKKEACVAIVYIYYAILSFIIQIYIYYVRVEPDFSQLSLAECSPNYLGSSPRVNVDVHILLDLF